MTLLFLATLFGLAIGDVSRVEHDAGVDLRDAEYGTVMGLMTIVTKGMAVVAVRFIGEVYDAAGSYLPGFITFSIAMLISMRLVAMLKPQPGSREARIAAANA